jgi:SAM-dependent methyltransferase
VTADDPTGWFERLYAAAAEGAAEVPWERGGPHPLLAEWARGRDGAGRRALVVGAGLGDDAELLAAAGFDTVAFDISPTAVRTARERFPRSGVTYRTADLLDPPAEWREAFDLVAEVFTVQSLPEPHRGRAITNGAGLVAPGGTLVVVAAGREPGEPADGPPWPLTRGEIDAFATGGLEAVRVEDLRDVPGPGERRWRVELRRSPSPS